MLPALVTVDPQDGVLRRYERNSGAGARLSHVGGMANWPPSGTADIAPWSVESFRRNPPTECAVHARGAQKPPGTGPGPAA